MPATACEVKVLAHSQVAPGIRLLAALEPGDTLLLTGPSGNGFDAAAAAGRIAVVGGGITTGADALEFIMAGAAAVQVGTASFMDPRAGGRITAEIGEWMDRHGVKNLDEIRGCARM